VDHDLIIVGGGPVGASLARAAHGLSVALVAHERRVAAPRKERFDARVYALSPANAAFLGLALDSLTPVHAMRVYGDGDSRIEFDAYRAGVAALAYIVEDRELQDALWQGLEPVVGRCEGLAVEEARVRVTLDGARELSGRLVVAADGAESRIREFAEIKVTSKMYGQAAVVANFACERAHGNVAYQWFQGGPVLALLPLPGEHVSMVWSLPTEEAARISTLDPDALCGKLEAASQRALGVFELVTPARTYPLRRVAARRMVAPRVALAGDAAHVIHPLAGQGLNLGLQDVRTLSRILDAREPVRDAGDWRLLRRYERARAEPILAMDAMVDGLQRFFGARGAFATRLRNRGLNLTDRFEVVKNLLIRQAMN